MSYPTIADLVLEAICFVCDRNGKDRQGRYWFRKDQMTSAQMLDRIVKAATGSDAKEPQVTISREISKLEGSTIKRVGHGEYVLVFSVYAELFHNGTLPKRLPGW